MVTELWKTEVAGERRESHRGRPSTRGVGERGEVASGQLGVAEREVAPLGQEPA